MAAPTMAPTTVVCDQWRQATMRGRTGFKSDYTESHFIVMDKKSPQPLPGPRGTSQPCQPACCPRSDGNSVNHEYLFDAAVTSYRYPCTLACTLEYAAVYVAAVYAAPPAARRTHLAKAVPYCCPGCRPRRSVDSASATSRPQTKEKK